MTEPPPPPEFCFLWIDHWSTCMTKAEWSGWMQAGGSVIGIAVAIAVPAWLWVAERRHATVKAAAHREQQRQLAISLIGDVAYFCEKNAAFFAMAAGWSGAGISALKEAVQELRFPLLQAPLWDFEDPELALEISRVAAKANFLRQQLDMGPAAAGPVALLLKKNCEAALERLNAA